MEPECILETMAARLQNKISMDTAADSCSLNSFSFSGLLCVQDQQSKSLPTNRANQIHKQGTEFEFGHTTPQSIVTDPIKHYPADLLISNGQIIPKAIVLQSTQHVLTNQPCIKDSVRAACTSSKRSTDNTGGTETAKPNPEFGNQEKKENPAPGSWFGQKIFKSFLFPCKECRVSKPTQRGHRIPEENGKLH